MSDDEDELKEELEVVKGSCYDMLFSGPRLPYHFGTELGIPKDAVLDTREIYLLIRRNQAGMIILMVAQWILVITFIIASGCVDGFGKIVTSGTEVTAMTHSGWWSAIEIVTLAIGGSSIHLGLNLNSKGQMERGVGGVQSCLKVYIAAIIVTIVSDLIHFAFTVNERRYCNSTLCATNPGWLTFVFAALATMVVLSVWIIYRAMTYYYNLTYSLDVSDENLFSSPTAAESMQSTLVPLPSATVSVPQQKQPVQYLITATPIAPQQQHPVNPALVVQQPQAKSRILPMAINSRVSRYHHGLKSEN